jgi:tyrosine-specific transport protein
LLELFNFIRGLMSQTKNFIGSVFMVSGCAMGAGCLAIPMLSAGPNFIFSSIFIIILGLFSYLLASISLEIFLTHKNSSNVSTIVNVSFGRSGVVVSGIINCVLMYALLSIYMTGGADVLSKTILPLIGIKVTDKVSLLIFLILFLPIFLKGVEIVVKSNKIIFYIKLFSFLF